LKNTFSDRPDACQSGGGFWQRLDGQRTGCSQHIFGRIAKITVQLKDVNGISLTAGGLLCEDNVVAVSAMTRGYQMRVKLLAAQDGNKRFYADANWATFPRCGDPCLLWAMLAVLDLIKTSKSAWSLTNGGQAEVRTTMR